MRFTFHAFGRILWWLRARTGSSSGRLEMCRLKIQMEKQLLLYEREKSGFKNVTATSGYMVWRNLVQRDELHPAVNLKEATRIFLCLQAKSKCLKAASYTTILGNTILAIYNEVHVVRVLDMFTTLQISLNATREKQRFVGGWRPFLVSSREYSGILCSAASCPSFQFYCQLPLQVIWRWNCMLLHKMPWQMSRMQPRSINGVYSLSLPSRHVTQLFNGVYGDLRFISLARGTGRKVHGRYARGDSGESMEREREGDNRGRNAY